jgi:hypothetical protein
MEPENSLNKIPQEEKEAVSRMGSAVLRLIKNQK